MESLKSKIRRGSQGDTTRQLADSVFERCFYGVSLSKGAICRLPTRAPRPTDNGTYEIGGALGNVLLSG